MGVTSERGQFKAVKHPRVNPIGQHHGHAPCALCRGEGIKQLAIQFDAP
ncbi:hypothetical protein LOY54_13050 [Pseudomonas sp. B21-032]|nr:hypothetical protein [Pseudomonas sp. B21-032]UVL64158.1 hypothetical protein LOY54_13050 [Pseudomonas sp. B21-032]